MPDEPLDLVLEHLRAIRARQDGDGALLREVNDRLTRVEIGVSHIRRDQALDAETSERRLPRSGLGTVSVP